LIKVWITLLWIDQIVKNNNDLSSIIHLGRPRPRPLLGAASFATALAFPLPLPAMLFGPAAEEEADGSCPAKNPVSLLNEFTTSLIF